MACIHHMGVWVVGFVEVNAPHEACDDRYAHRARWMLDSSIHTCEASVCHTVPNLASPAVGM